MSSAKDLCLRPKRFMWVKLSLDAYQFWPRRGIRGVQRGGASPETIRHSDRAGHGPPFAYGAHAVEGTN